MPETNFDKITKTKRDLAEFIGVIGHYSEYCCDNCAYYNDCYKEDKDGLVLYDPKQESNAYCVEGIEKWLKSKYKEDEE